MAGNADIYLDKMDLQQYCRAETCELCRVNTFEEFVTKIRRGEIAGGDCPHWPRGRVEAFRLALDAAEIIPPVPFLDMPRPAPPGLIELMPASDKSPVLVTGNSEFTQAVMLAILSLAANPVKLLSVDCKGHTVDMALIFNELTAAGMAAALQQAGVTSDKKARVIIPGLASRFAPELEKAWGGPVEVGPVCAAEIPLYMGKDWKSAK